MDPRHSLLRALEYEAIAGLELTGRTLDVGGGATSSYYCLLMGSPAIESVNISSDYKPTIIAYLNNALPIANNTYDDVLSLNTYEHVYNDSNALVESIRVLKSGGRFLFVVPFLYRVHGSPSDYHRHTHHYWVAKLMELGIDPYSLVVGPLLWDRVAFATSILLGTGLALRISMLWGIWKCRGVRAERLPPTKRSLVQLEYALGYCMRGTKSA